MKPEIKLLRVHQWLQQAGCSSPVKMDFADPGTNETLVCTTRHHTYTMSFAATAQSLAYALADNLRREAAGHARLENSCPFCPASTEGK